MQSRRRLCHRPARLPSWRRRLPDKKKIIHFPPRPQITTAGWGSSSEGGTTPCCGRKAKSTCCRSARRILASTKLQVSQRKSWEGVDFRSSAPRRITNPMLRVRTTEIRIPGGGSFGITDILLLVAPHAKNPRKRLAPVTCEARSRCFAGADLSDSLPAVTRTRFASTARSQPLEDKGNKPAWPQDLGGHFYQAAPAAAALMELDVSAALERQQSENWLSFPPRRRRR